jgi:hypothetical protein
MYDEYEEECEEEGNCKRPWPLVLGAFSGLAAALTVYFTGVLTALLIVGLICVGAVAGWLIGKCAAGDIDPADLYDRHVRDRGR